MVAVQAREARKVVFLGPAAVGKTEFAGALANLLPGTQVHSWSKAFENNPGFDEAILLRTDADHLVMDQARRDLLAEITQILTDEPELTANLEPESLTAGDLTELWFMVRRYQVITQELGASHGRLFLEDEIWTGMMYGLQNRAGFSEVGWQLYNAS